MFKCVSKSWNRPISDICIPRVFAEACVLNLYRGFLRKICDSRYISDKKPEVNYVGSIPKDKDKCDIYHEIDCCKCCRPDYACPYVVVSLETNQCFHIPEPLEHVESNYAALIFDPVQSNDYKVVLPHSHLECPMLDMFSSEHGKWVRHLVPGDWVKYPNLMLPTIEGLNGLRRLYTWMGCYTCYLRKSILFSSTSNQQQCQLKS